MRNAKMTLGEQIANMQPSTVQPNENALPSAPASFPQCRAESAEAWIMTTAEGRSATADFWQPLPFFFNVDAARNGATAEAPVLDSTAAIRQSVSRGSGNDGLPVLNVGSA